MTITFYGNLFLLLSFSIKDILARSTCYIKNNIEQKTNKIDNHLMETESVRDNVTVLTAPMRVMF